MQASLGEVKQDITKEPQQKMETKNEAITSKFNEIKQLLTPVFQKDLDKKLKLIPISNNDANVEVIGEFKSIAPLQKCLPNFKINYERTERGFKNIVINSICQPLNMNGLAALSSIPLPRLDFPAAQTATVSKKVEKEQGDKDKETIALPIPQSSMVQTPQQTP